MKLSFAVTLSLALAYPVYGADLLELYQAAESADAAYASARAARLAGIEKLPQARAGLRPEVNLKSDLTGNYVKNHLAHVSGSFIAADYTLSLSQPLYRRQTSIIVDQAERQVFQAETQLNLALQDLIVRASQAYFDVLLAQDKLSASQAQKAAISEQLAQAKRNFEVGTATITDTHEAQARYDLAVAQEIADSSDLEVKRRALEILTARPPSELSVLQDKVTLPLPQPNDMQEWVKVAQEQNPQVVILKAGEEIADKEIERNRAAYAPTIDAVANVNQSSNTKRDIFLGSETSGAAVGVQLNIPIWEGGLRQSRVREAVANREKARQDLENARRQNAQLARQAFLGVTNGVSQVKALEQAVVSTQSQLDSTKLGQEVGVRTGVDVLNAQQQLFSARRDLYAARYNTILNQLKLKQAAGILSKNDLIEINTTLKPPGAAPTTPQGQKPVPAPTQPAKPVAPPKPAAPGAGAPPRTGAPGTNVPDKTIKRPLPARPPAAKPPGGQQ
jgi:outer membrane protein